MDDEQRQHRTEEIAVMHNELVALLDRMDVATIFLDANFTIKHFTPAITRILPLKPADIGRPLNEINREFGSGLLTDVLRALSTLSPVETIVQNGHSRWYRRRILPYRMPHTSVPNLVIVFTAISEIQDAEMALLQSETRFRLTIDSFPYTFVVYDADRRIQFINAAGIRISGLTEAAILGHRDEELFPADATNAYLPLLQQAVATRTPQTGECRVQLFNQTHHIVVNYVPLLDEQGAIQQILGITHDVTAHREAEASLRDSEARLRMLFEFSRDAIVVTNSEGHYVDANRAACELLGYSREELLHMSVGDLQVPMRQRSAQEQFHDYRISGEGGDEFTFIRPDGQIRTVEYSAQQFSPGFHVSIMRDITERLHAAEERRKFEARLQQTQKLESLGVLAGGIAHDFNNLLMGIFGFADLALMDMEPEHPARESIEQILISARRAAELTHQMLAYSGRGKFVIKAFQLSRVIKDMAHLLEVSISKRCKLHYHLAENLPTIEGDVSQIHQVMMNLVINASEAIGERNGEITITTGIRECDRTYLADCYFAETLPEGVYLYVEVTDTGSGISDEVRTRMFDPFFTTKFTGRGLGLAVVLGIVRGHSGTIRVTSTLGAGTSFRVHFPVLSTPTIIPHLPQANITTWQGQGTILVADDEETVRTVARRLLETAGFDVMVARDGCEAVDLFRAHQGSIRVVLLDMTMPCMDGEETIQIIRAIDASMPVILSSGYNEQEAINRFVGAGLAAFIHKPYRYETLLQAIRTALEPQTAD